MLRTWHKAHFVEHHVPLAPRHWAPQIKLNRWDPGRDLLAQGYDSDKLLAENKSCCYRRPPGTTRLGTVDYSCSNHNFKTASGCRGAARLSQPVRGRSGHLQCVPCSTRGCPDSKRCCRAPLQVKVVYVIAAGRLALHVFRGSP